jgi:hypothetical protein
MTVARTKGRPETESLLLCGKAPRRGGPASGEAGLITRSIQPWTVKLYARDHR